MKKKTKKNIKIVGLLFIVLYTVMVGKILYKAATTPIKMEATK